MMLLLKTLMPRKYLLLSTLALAYVATAMRHRARRTDASRSGELGEQSESPGQGGSWVQHAPPHSEAQPSSPDEKAKLEEVPRSRKTPRDRRSRGEAADSQPEKPADRTVRQILCDAAKSFAGMIMGNPAPAEAHAREQPHELPGADSAHREAIRSQRDPGQSGRNKSLEDQIFENKYTYLVHRFLLNYDEKYTREQTLGEILKLAEPHARGKGTDRAVEYVYDLLLNQDMDPNKLVDFLLDPELS